MKTEENRARLRGRFLSVLCPGEAPITMGPGPPPRAQRGEKLTSSHLTQFAVPRRRLMSSLRPPSHRYHFPNQVTKLVLKLPPRSRADCYQGGVLPAIWPRVLLQCLLLSTGGGGQASCLCLHLESLLPPNARSPGMELRSPQQTWDSCGRESPE